MDSTAWCPRFAPGLSHGTRMGSTGFVAVSLDSYVLRSQLRRHRRKLGCDGAVDHGVADRDARAAAERRVDADRRFDLSAKAFFERGLEIGFLRISQWKGGVDARLGHAVGIVLERLEQ